MLFQNTDSGQVPLPHSYLTSFFQGIHLIYIMLNKHPKVEKQKRQIQERKDILKAKSHAKTKDIALMAMTIITSQLAAGFLPAP